MSLRIYNSLTQTKEMFTPVRPGKVGMYVCGPTVYKPSHIGHAVGPVIFDTVKRYLQFKGFEVNWVVNITDVDDKLIDEAKLQGCRVPELAERVTAGYLEALNQLGVHGIDHMPKASENIPGIIEMCQRLIEKNAAYVVGGDVYFDVSTSPEYGKLSHRRPEDQQAGSRELAGGQKRNPGDFALWKSAKPDEPDEVKYDSPWGKGRPGWHIECSVMSSRYLGETFDIHGGGIDLIFPHHENEIAQSETCHDVPFAKYWMHNNLTRFKTKKISKSDPEMAKRMEELMLNNLLGRYPAELLRFTLLSTHYRRPIEFSPEELDAKSKGLESFYRLFERIERLIGKSVYDGGEDIDAIHGSAETDPEKAIVNAALLAKTRFLEAMDDDFNTAVAISVLFELVNTINRYMDEHRLETSDYPRGVALAGGAVQSLRGLAQVLGLFEKPPTVPDQSSQLVAALMNVLIAVRAQARVDKQFALADMVRDRLNELNIRLEDRPDGTGWRLGK